MEADEWVAIDVGEMDPPKILIRHSAAYSDTYEKRKPMTAYDPECSQIQYFEALAEIIEQEGIQQ